MKRTLFLLALVAATTLVTTSCGSRSTVPAEQTSPGGGVDTSDEVVEDSSRVEPIK